MFFILLANNFRKNNIFFIEILAAILVLILSTYAFAHDVKLNKATLYSDLHQLNLFLHEESFQALAKTGTSIEALITVKPCQAINANKSNNTDGKLVVINYRCDQPESSIDFQSLLTQLPEYTLIFEHRNRENLLQQKLITATSTQVELTQRQTSYSTLLDYLKLGTNHILQGYDHLFFLLALTLLLGWTRQLFNAVIGFTIGHGVAITLASFQIIHLETELVEIIIGWSITVIALEALFIARAQTLVYIVSGLLIGLLLFTDYWWTSLAVGLVMAGYFGLKQTDRFGPLAIGIITVIFGIYHGLGFSQLLLSQELDISTIWKAVLGFNLGVELGQFIVIVLGYSLALLVLKYSRENWHSLMREITASLALTAGVFWFTTRSLAQFVF